MRRGIKNLTIMVALVNLISSANIGDAKADKNRKNYIIDKNRKLIVVDDIRILQNNGKTFVNDWDVISIFNEENTISRQYGGNQSVFMYYPNFLLKDPLIWEEMQKRWPVSDYSSEDEAMDFYELYFNTIARNGCAFVSIVDKVFQTFEGKEEEFEKKFGYKRYAINEDNSIEFNYPIMILQLINYCALYPNYNKENIEKVKAMYAKSLARRALTRYEYSDEYRIDPNKWKELEGEEQKEYVFKVSARNAKYYDLKAAYDNAKDVPYDISFDIIDTQRKVKKFFEGYGITVDFNVEEVTDYGDFKPGDIICADNFDLYKEDNGERYSEVDDIKPHAVYVTEVDCGRVIVSSWGQRFIFSGHGAKCVYKLSMTVKVKSNIKGR